MILAMLIGSELTYNTLSSSLKVKKGYITDISLKFFSKEVIESMSSL